MNTDLFRTIEYLKDGTPVQQYCYNTLTQLGIMEYLKPYDPILAGTIPIEIDIESSDADIICHAPDLRQIQEDVRKRYDSISGFTDYISTGQYIASFTYNSLPVEIYAEDRPTLLQNGYRHMIVEYRILELAGVAFKDEIIRLKLSGYKTEPAFGKLLHLKEPYAGLFELSAMTDRQLSDFIRSATLQSFA